MADTVDFTFEAMPGFGLIRLFRDGQSLSNSTHMFRPYRVLYKERRIS